jgi:hypothetical protein
MEMENPGLMTRFTVAELIKLPLVPVITRGKVPTGVDKLVTTRMVVGPELLTEAGLKAAVTPVGSPLTLNVTTPLNPPVAVTVAL